MAPSKNAVELMALLVDEAYGELTSRIFTILLRRGRLPIRLLSMHTLLTPRQLRHGLAVLIQQGLVYHNLEVDTGTTFYEANDDAAYGLARAGKIMDVAENRFGPAARDVVHKLFLLGHCSVSDLVTAYESKNKDHANGNAEGSSTITNDVNGQSVSPVDSIGQLHSVLIQLLDSGFVEPVVRSMFHSPEDTHSMIERQILQESFGGSTKGAKQKDELKLKIKNRMNAIRAEREWKGNAKKRPLNGEHINGINGTNKRRRLSNGSSTVSGDPLIEDDGSRLDPTLVIHINYEKCNVALRNEALVAFAKERIGEITSLIFAQGLAILEKKIPRCRINPSIDKVVDLPDGPGFTTKELTTVLSKAVNPGTGIGKASSGEVNTRALERLESRKHKSEEVKIEGDVSMGDGPDEEPTINGHTHLSDIEDDDDPFEEGDKSNPAKRRKLVTFQAESSGDRENRLELVKKHLMLLATDDAKFLRRTGNNGYGEWTCDFETLVAKMQESEVDALLLENFGISGHRLARMLRRLGKLDEKTMVDTAKLKPKDIRTKLAEMQMAGVIDIQEVPRDSNRTTNRTIFLWFFDEARAATMVTEHTYKAMSRILQRLDIERRRAHDVLALTKRSDVRDFDPEVYLDANQLNDFRAIDAKIDNLLCQIGRLDGLIGLFQEF
ncbi:DNA directed RNA polymerase-like protein III subunit Rpc82 [Mollisia scopiformis]|uniref:DNA-directed RNA polymerase III subunit RPC3 n=1 Tax=Mollisia scopiformis TaxID=149040 RepID=A0A132B7U3_MOLSC|nr:DNA directed RNA polymerase-like protein III subunit Rpc82 [Mollisia scopiformis]KUJ08472.1 DNA directed RNA polymeras-like protein III subunit Rpc82 [Mollisia scopiformis]